MLHKPFLQTLNEQDSKVYKEEKLELSD